MLEEKIDNGDPRKLFRVMEMLYRLCVNYKTVYILLALAFKNIQTSVTSHHLVSYHLGGSLQ